MSLRRRLRTLACCSVLQMAAFLGMPMRPEQVQDLMRTLNAPKLARTTPDDSARGDDPAKDLPADDRGGTSLGPRPR